MKTITKLGLISFLSFNISLVSSAEFESNVAISSDYIWRGWTQSNEDPSISGGFDISSENGLYFGTWAASITGGTELDYYFGYSGESENGLGYDIGYIGYTYPQHDSAFGLDWDFEEIYLGLSYEFIGLIYSAGQDDAEDNLELSLSLGDTGLGATFGQYDNMGDYYTISYELPIALAGLTVSLGYSDLSADGDSSLDEDGFYITFSM